MKTMWAVAAIVLLLVCGNTYGQEPATHYSNHKYVRNTALPPDCVELAVDSPSQGFYRTPPKERPANVPPTYVLVQVFVQDGQFIGWIYMEADVVRFLHGQPIHRDDARKPLTRM
jgi:hypothetical protein